MLTSIFTFLIFCMNAAILYLVYTMAMGGGGSSLTHGHGNSYGQMNALGHEKTGLQQVGIDEQQLTGTEENPQTNNEASLAPAVGTGTERATVQPAEQAASSGSLAIGSQAEEGSNTSNLRQKSHLMKRTKAGHM